jgi:hypothetical protein
LTDPLCKDALTCHANVSIPASGKFEVEIWDADIAEDDLIAKGECEFGKTCQFPSTVIAIAEKSISLPIPDAAKAPPCGKTTPDGSKIQALPATPESGNPKNRRAEDRTTIFDYDVTECEGVRLEVDQQDAKSWTYTCHHTCADPTSLGALQMLAKNEVALNVTTTWYLVTNGNLKDNILAVTPLEEGGQEIVLQSIAGIQDAQSYFIANWLCKNQSAVPGVNPTKCQSSP